MNNKILLKIFVLAIVSVFILEMLAIPLLSNTSGQQNSGDSNASQTGYMTGDVNGTLIGYSNYISVEGPLASMEDKKKEWIESGLVSSETHVTSNSTILNLNNGSAIETIAPYLLEKGFVVRSEGSIEIQEMLGNITAGNVVRLKMLPTLPIGTNVSLTITAYVENNEVTNVLAAELIPLRKIIMANATVSKVDSTKVYITSNINSNTNASISTGPLAGLNITDVNGTTVITTELPCSELEGKLNELNVSGTYVYKQNLKVNVLPNPTDGLVAGTSLSVLTDGDKCVSENDTISMSIDAVLYEGAIKRIVKYEIK